MLNYTFLTRCRNYAELASIESVLFTLRFDNDPGLAPFFIIVDNTKFYYHTVEKDGSYYIVTE